MTTNTRRLIEVMARLRDPEGGCPWDLEQGEGVESAPAFSATGVKGGI